jgi:hypothetical protein
MTPQRIPLLPWTGNGEANRHFRPTDHQYEIFNPIRLRWRSKITSTQQIPYLAQNKTFDALNFSAFYDIHGG